jgi:hypothetical protein
MRRTIVVATLWLAFLATAHSQEIKGECFQVVSPVAGTSPASFLLLNKCSGATWMLVRVLESEGKPGKADYFTYKWLPLSTGEREPQTVRLP